METLVLNGKTYVKASKAARDLGYTSDYVGQLCRGKHVDAHLVGRTWYVNPDELSTHRVEKKRMSRVKAREQVHKSIEEHRQLHAQKIENNYKNVAIHYETDDGALIPKLRKLSIESTTPKEAEKKPVVDEAYTVENAGKKISFSGKLKIVDASDDVIDDATVVMSPKIDRHTMHRQEAHPDFFKKELEHLEETAVEEPQSIVEPVVQQEIVASTESIGEPQRGTEKVFHTTKIVLSIILFLIIASASLFVESTWSYTKRDDTTGYTFHTTYTLNFVGIKTLVSHKI